MKITLHAQASAVSIAAPRPAAWDHIAPGLSAAFLTLLSIQSWRDRLLIAAPGFIEEIEASE